MPLGLGPEVGQDPEHLGLVTQALMEQSSAITSLVAHLASGDAIRELASSSSTVGGHGLNMRGVSRRERMQRELAEGSSSYFLQFHQQLYRKMFPICLKERGGDRGLECHDGSLLGTFWELPSESRRGHDPVVLGTLCGLRSCQRLPGDEGTLGFAECELGSGLS